MPNYAFELKSLQKEESCYKALHVSKRSVSGVYDACLSSWLKTSSQELWDPQLLSAAQTGVTYMEVFGRPREKRGRKE